MGDYLLLNLGLAAWMYRDGTRRYFPIVPWCLAAVPLGWLMLPLYLARRPLREGEEREGGAAWDALKNFCLVWTLTMFVAAVGRMGNAWSPPEAAWDAGQAVRAIGAALGQGSILVLWFVPLVGAALLGALLKKSSVVERGPTGYLRPIADDRDDERAGLILRQIRRSMPAGAKLLVVGYVLPPPCEVPSSGRPTDLNMLILPVEVASRAWNRPGAKHEFELRTATPCWARSSP
jgi:hypothetical protein